mgnify:CR=1 FL=1
MKQANSTSPTRNDLDSLPEIDPRLLELERELEEAGRTLDDTITREMALRARQRQQGARS